MNTTIETVCPICGAYEGIEVAYEDYVSWEGGTLIQDAFPYLTADKREQLMTGICVKCWDDSFGGE